MCGRYVGKESLTNSLSSYGRRRSVERLVAVECSMTVAARQWRRFLQDLPPYSGVRVASDRKSRLISSVHKTSDYDSRPSMGGGGLRWACVCVIDEKWSTRSSFTLLIWIFPRCEFQGNQQPIPTRDERELRSAGGLVENFSHCQNDLVFRAVQNQRQGISRMSSNNHNMPLQNTMPF